MAGRSLADQIRHYQRDIERCPENTERMIRCIQRLYVLPILVQHLQETGVGRSVNSLRKYDGEVGNAAKALVAKWKAMVAAEEAAELEQLQQRREQEKPPDPPPSVSEVRESENGRHKSKKSSSSRDKNHKRRDDERSSDRKKSSHRHHKETDSHSRKRRHSDDSDSSPSRRKRKKHCVRDKRRHRDDDSESESEVEEEESERPSSAEEEEVEEEEDTRGKSSEDDRDASDGENDSDSSDSSSDHRHRSKKSSQSSSKEKNSSSSSRHKSSSSRNRSKSNSGDDDKEMVKERIKENEKRVKKENSDAGEPSSQKSESSPSKGKVKVKLEKHADGIDGTSGFSFADALLGVESSSKKKKKKSEPSKSSKTDNHDDSSSSKRDKPSSSKSHSSSSKSHHSGSSKHSSSSSKTHHSSSSSSVNHRSSPSSSNHHTSTSSSSNKKTDKNVPDLLKNPVKLETFDFDINSTLPEITPNYRPLPHVPDRKPLKPSMSDEDHMFNLMTTKNQRTKVYSGAKYGSVSSVPSLYSLCIQLLYENIDAVEYTGGVPYDILKPLLQKLNSDQLYVIEHFNPYLIEDTDLLWEFHCKKDFRNEKRQDMESWRELYMRCMDEREKKLKALTANINESIAKSTPVRTAKLAYVDSMAKPPRNVARKQAKYGTGAGSSSTATIASLGANTAQKQEILCKAMVGANTPGVEAPVAVSAPPNPRSQTSFSSATPKKKKAPLMAKALQLIKGNRFKR